MRLKKLLVLSLAMLMVALLLASCGEEAEEGKKTETVTIGLTAPLSGAGAGYGEDIKAGIDIAMKEINDEGGLVIGDTAYKFKLEAADDAMVPDTSKANAERFVLEKGINVVWDPTANTITPLMEINTKAGEEFLIMAYSSVPLYTEKVNPLMITLPPSFAVYVKPFLTAAMSKGWMKLGMIQTTGAYGKLWGDTFEKAWVGAGGTVVAKAEADYYTTTDFTANLTTILAAKPDVILCGGPSEPTGLVIDQARGLGYTGGFIVIDQAKLDVIEEMTGMEKLEGCIGVLPVELATDLWPAMTDFSKDYREQYGKTVTWETAICYTSFHILARAMENAGTVSDIKAIREAFPESSVTSGEEFPVGYAGINDQTGHLLMPGTMVMVENGEWVPGEPIEWWKAQ